MNKLLFTALLAGSTAVATPAFAQASGAVDVTGFVKSRCGAITPIAGHITLGELSRADGTVDPSFSNNTGGLSRGFTVSCNGSNPKITVDARPLVNASSTNPPAGYTNTVHYTATVVARGARGGNTPISNQSLIAGSTSAQVGDRLAAAANNVTLTVGTGVTATSNAILDAGRYAGKVEITIAPEA